MACSVAVGNGKNVMERNQLGMKEKQTHWRKEIKLNDKDKGVGVNKKKKFDSLILNVAGVRCNQEKAHLIFLPHKI